MKKLRGFTLMELLVGMIISGIVISAGYFSFDIIFKQFINYKKLNTTISQALMVEVIMQKDFSRSAAVHQVNERGFSCTGEQDAVIYEFYEGYILRKSGEIISDTFFIPVDEMQATFLNQPQDLPGGLIDVLSFKARIEGETETFHITKRYDTKVLMEHETQKNNGTN